MYIIRIVLLWTRLVQRARFGLIDALSMCLGKFRGFLVNWTNLSSSV